MQTCPHCQDNASPPHFELFDIDVHRSFAECTGCDVPDSAWRQAQLSLRRGGFGLRSLALHSPAAFLCGSGSVIPTPHLENAITHYNTCVPLSDSLSISGLVGHTPTQKKLSDAIEERCSSTLSLIDVLLLTRPDCCQYHLPTLQLGFQLSLPPAWDCTLTRMNFKQQ